MIAQPLLMGGLQLLDIDAAYLDGTYSMARGAALTGVTDSKMFTVAGWIRPDVGCTGGGILSGGLLGVGPIFNMYWDFSTQKIAVEAYDSTPLVRLNVKSTGTAPEATWTPFLFSVDMADVGKRHFYVGDVPGMAVTTYTNATLDLTYTDWAVGSVIPNATYPNGQQWLVGGIAEFLFFPGVYVDFSLRANRDLFYLGNKPVKLSAPGTTFATLGAPAIYLHLDPGEAADDFRLNDDGGATGGTFTLTSGALSTAATSPSD